MNKRAQDSSGVCAGLIPLGPSVLLESGQRVCPPVRGSMLLRNWVSCSFYFPSSVSAGFIKHLIRCIQVSLWETELELPSSPTLSFNSKSRGSGLRLPFCPGITGVPWITEVPLGQPALSQTDHYSPPRVQSLRLRPSSFPLGLHRHDPLSSFTAPSCPHHRLFLKAWGLQRGVQYPSKQNTTCLRLRNVLAIPLPRKEGSAAACY